MVHRTLSAYDAEARSWVGAFFDAHGRAPTRAEFAAAAVEFDSLG